MGATNLSQLIEDFRRSRTKNEERMMVQKHRGFLRENMKTLDHQQRANGILKLMWMNMLGYDTEFALVECMNSLFLDNFKLKTVGYLGLTMFLSRKSEVLLMVTNRLRLDLENRTNDFVVSAALKTFSEIADDHMAQELFPILRGLLEHESKYIRKKVCLALQRVLLQKPDMALDLKPSFVSLMRENNNGLLLCTLHLARQVMRIRPREFHRLFCDAQSHLLNKLRQTSSKSNGNYMINGINDPFLQATLIGFLLEFLSLPQTRALDNFEDLVGEFGSCLLGVYREIQNYGGSTARAIFYQVARAIMQIPYSAIALKKVGIAILGSFLGLKNRNYLFVSLKMLCLISQKYSSEVSRHNSLIMKCVNDKDFSIKRLALEILLHTTDADNLAEVCRLFFRELAKQSNPRLAGEMARQSLHLIHRAAATRVEVVDLVFELLQALHSSVKLTSETLKSFFHVVANAPSIQAYACLRALHLLGSPVNRVKKSLVFAGCWMLGEFGESLTLGKDLQSGARFEKVQWRKTAAVLMRIDPPDGQAHVEVAMSLLTALLKIFHKATDLETKQAIVTWFISRARRDSQSVSQKCRQYLRLMRFTPADLEEVLESLGFTDEATETELQSKQQGGVEVAVLDRLARDINQDRFASGQSQTRYVGRASSGEEHVVNQKNEKADREMAELEDATGGVDNGNEMEMIDFLQMEVEPESVPTEPATAHVPTTPNDVNLLGDDFDFGIETPEQNLTSQPPANENDFLGMVSSVPEKNRDRLSQNIDQMMSQEINPQSKKKGLGKPRTRKPATLAEDPVPKDIDFLGKAEPVPTAPQETNFDLLDDIDLMGTQASSQTNGIDQNGNLGGQYAALDELDDVLVRGNEAKLVDLNPGGGLVQGQSPAPTLETKPSAKDYDCLDLGTNTDSLLTTGLPAKTPNLLDADDDFGDDDFVECEVAPETQTREYKTFFENPDIRVEHWVRTSGLNLYQMEHLFSNKLGQPMTGLRLNIQLQKHVKTKVNRLSSSSVQALSTRTVSQTLELEDHSGFAKPLKIKMTLKYTVLGAERVHQFIVNKFI